MVSDQVACSCPRTGGLLDDAKAALETRLAAKAEDSAKSVLLPVLLLGIGTGLATGLIIGYVVGRR